MTASDAQIEIAILASIERQAKRTAAALDEIAGTLAAMWKSTDEERGDLCHEK